MASQDRLPGSMRKVATRPRQAHQVALGIHLPNLLGATFPRPVLQEVTVRPQDLLQICE